MSGHHGMAMAFTGGPEVTILFKNIHINTPLGLMAAFFLFVLFSVVYEGLKYFKITIAQKSKWRDNKKSCLTVAHAIQTALFFINFLFANMLMLTVMTYNIWLLIAIVLGSTIGYQICTYISHGHTPTKPSACHSPTTENGEKPADHHCHENGTDTKSLPGCHVAAITAFMESKDYHGSAAPYDNGCAFPGNDIKPEKGNCCQDGVYAWEDEARPVPGYDKEHPDESSSIKLNGTTIHEEATSEERKPLTSSI